MIETEATEAGGASGAPGDHSRPNPALELATATKQARGGIAPTKPVYVPVKRYKVEARTRLNLGGQLVWFEAGKVIDENQYDVAKLVTQGVQLTELDPLPDPFAQPEAKPAEA